MDKLLNNFFLIIFTLIFFTILPLMYGDFAYANDNLNHSSDNQVGKSDKNIHNIDQGSSIIAIVIDDLGHSDKKLLPFLELDVPLTLAFLPYPKKSRDLAKLAKKQGYEILVHMPMEPLDKNIDPGPDALTSVLNIKDMKDSFRRNFKKIDGAKGINNHMGSKLSLNKSAMEIIIGEVASRNLLYFDSVTVSGTYGWRIAEKRNIPFAKRDIFIDNVKDIEVISQQLKALETKAIENGFSVGIGHPYSVTHKALSNWLHRIEGKGIKIVPLSEIAIKLCRCNNIIVND